MLITGFVLIRDTLRFDDYDVFQRCIITSVAQQSVPVLIKISFLGKYFNVIMHKYLWLTLIQANLYQEKINYCCFYFALLIF
jgi:hypothetical protein